MKPQFDTTTNVIGARIPGQPAFVWQRDLSNCLEAILKTTVVMVENSLASVKNTHEKLEALDTIMQYYVRVYVQGKSDNTQGLLALKELFEYVRKDKIKTEVYNTFAQYFTYSVFVYLLASPAMLAESGNMSEEDYTLGTFLSGICLLDKKSRCKILAATKMVSIFPNTVDFRKFTKDAHSYIDEIIENQNKRRLKNENH